MNHFLQKPVNWFFSGYQLKWQTYWFKNLLYTFVILKSIAWLIFYDFYFGEHAVIYSNYFKVDSFRETAFWLYACDAPKLGTLFLIPLFILCLWSLWVKRFYFLPDVLIWFLIVNLNNKVYPALTGGDYLLNQMLLFNCFLSASYVVKNKWLSDLKMCLHNLALIAVFVQVCLVYFISALAKINDAGWISGSALGEVALINHFNLYSPIYAGNGFNFLFVFLNYLIVCYQLVFPVMVWFKRVKKPFIMIGLLMHLYIALVMGIVEFGVLMMICYIYFWPFKKTLS